MAEVCWEGLRALPRAPLPPSTLANRAFDVVGGLWCGSAQLSTLDVGTTHRRSQNFFFFLLFPFSKKKKRPSWEKKKKILNILKVPESSCVWLISPKLHLRALLLTLAFRALQQFRCELHYFPIIKAIFSPLAMESCDRNETRARSTCVTEERSLRADCSFLLWLLSSACSSANLVHVGGACETSHPHIHTIHQNRLFFSTQAVFSHSG